MNVLKKSLAVKKYVANNETMIYNGKTIKLQGTMEKTNYGTIRKLMEL